MRRRVDNVLIELHSPLVQERDHRLVLLGEQRDQVRFPVPVQVRRDPGIEPVRLWM